MIVLPSPSSIFGCARCYYQDTRALQTNVYYFTILRGREGQVQVIIRLLS